MNDGPTIVLLPGNMCDERMWTDVLPAISDRATAYCLPTESTIEAMARTCLDTVPGQLIPVGFSMGGIVALAIADMAPERVAALALIATNAHADRPERMHERRRQQRAVIAGDLSEVIANELKPAYFAERNRSDETLRTRVLDMAIALGPEVFVAQSEALRTRRDYGDALDTIDVPAFIACGAQDALCPPALHERMAARMSDSELHVVPGAGHMLPLEQPRILSALLSDWLGRTRKDTRWPIAS